MNLNTMKRKLAQIFDRGLRDVDLLPLGFYRSDLYYYRSIEFFVVIRDGRFPFLESFTRRVIG